MMHEFLSSLWSLFPPALKRRIVWLFAAKFALGVSGVITNGEGSILLLKHRYWKGHAWGLPSGSVQRGESIAAALVREVREETKLEVQIQALLHVGRSSPLRMEFVFLARHSAGAPAIERGEILEARFFPLGELPDNLLPSHRRMIQLFRSHESAGSRWPDCLDGSDAVHL